MDARIGPAAPRGVATTADDDGVRVAAGKRAPAKEDLRRLDAVVAMAESFLLQGMEGTQQCVSCEGMRLPAGCSGTNRKGLRRGTRRLQRTNILATAVHVYVLAVADGAWLVTGTGSLAAV